MLRIKRFWRAVAAITAHNTFSLTLLDKTLLNKVKCYPFPEVSLNYSNSLLFHGGDIGSTPVRDAHT